MSGSTEDLAREIARYLNSSSYGRSHQPWNNKDRAVTYDEYKNIREDDSTEIEKLRQAKSVKAENDEWFETNAEELERINALRQAGIELTEEQIALQEESTKRARETAEALQFMKDKSTFSSFTNSLSNIGASFGGIISSLKGIESAISSLTEPWKAVDKAASKYAKTVGMTGKAMKNLGKDTNDNVINGRLALKYNVSTEELLEAQSNYIKAAGRNIRVDSADQESMAALRAMGGNGIDLAASYDKFGVSMGETADHVGKMFSDAAKQGLSFEKYSENVAKNINIAQNYTFKNGLKGLESMAKKATAMKLDMQQVARLADNVSSVEGAIDVASKLQVLGGPFAQMADPLGMMNEGLNDMEGLQDRLIKMIGGLGSFDKSTGEVSVSSFNKRRIKAAADAMGIDYSSVMESVNAQARRGEIEKQISASSVASGFDDDMKELIMNSGTIKDGKAGVSIRGQFKSLDELSGEDYEALKQESQTESEDIKDIAYNLRSVVDKEEGAKKQHRAEQAEFYRKTAETMANMYDELGKIRLIHKILLIMQAVQAGGQIINSLTSGFKSLKNLGGSLKNIGSMFKGGAKGIGNAIKGVFSKGGAKGLGNVAAKGAGNAVAKGAGKAAANAAAKGASKAAAKGAGKAAAKGAGKAAAKGAAKAAAKGAGKAAAAGAAKLGANLAKGVAAGGVAGVVGVVGDIATDALVANGKIKKGGTAHHVMKGGFGAATGAGTGALVGSLLFPGVGTLVGAIGGSILGGINGLLHAGKAKQERILSEKLKGTDITVKGKYSRRELKKINRALDGNGISASMRRELKKSGDTKLLEQIDKKTKEKAIKDKRMARRAAKRGLGGRGFLGKAVVAASPVGGMFLAGKALRNSKFGSKLPKGAMLGLGGILGAKIGGALKSSKGSKFGKALAMASPIGGMFLAGKALKNSKFCSKIPKGAMFGLGGILGAKIGGALKSSKGSKFGKALAMASPIGGMFLAGKALKNSKFGSKLPMGMGMLGLGLGAPLGFYGTSRGLFHKEHKKFKSQGLQKGASSILKRYTSQVKPVLEKGLGAKYGSVSRKGSNDIHIKNDPHDIKINGTLKLQGQDGKSVDMINELKNNPDMMRNLAGMVSNEMSVIQKGANIVQRT
jgi:hypothetical protein